MSSWTPYHKESAVLAKELCGSIKDPAEKFRVITEWITRNIAYDYMRAIQLAHTRGGRPDLPRTWKFHMGVCMDVSALAVNMLRAVGVRAYLCVGSADNNNRHAWVEALVGKERLRYDHANPNNTKIAKYKANSRY